MVILSDKKTPSLLSYKYYVRPTVHQLYGNSSPESKHQKNVQRILRMLALEGPMTTWDMAKIRYNTDTSKIRTKEKEYRRLIVGRKDRGYYSKGIEDFNLILVNNKSKRNSGNKYRLSIFGILYCLDVMKFENDEIDKIAKNYKTLIPLVFGKWDFLKSEIGEFVYNISLIGKGLIFDNQNIIKIKNDEFYDLISYFSIKSNNLIESYNEKIIGELISLWFYITLLYFPRLLLKTKNNKKYIKKILKKDLVIQKWFLDFIAEAQTFYKQRSKILEGISIV